MRVGRTLALGEDVLHTDRLEHGTHSTAGLHPGTGGSGFHEHLGATELRGLLVRDGLVDDRNLDEVLLRIFDTLLDGSGNFVRLTETITDDTILVTDHDDGRETEVTATLGHLGDPVDGYQSVLEFKVRGLYSFNICICHSPD